MSPLLILRYQNDRTLSRNDVIAGTQNRLVSSTPDPTNVLRYASSGNQPRMSQITPEKLNSMFADEAELNLKLKSQGIDKKLNQDSRMKNSLGLLMTQ